MTATDRVLAIDPSLRCTGYAVLDRGPRHPVPLVYGTIPNAASVPATRCLRAIHDTLATLIATHRPACVAIESVIYVQNYRTAILLGSARGVALLAAAQHDLPVFEYAPRLVKQAVVGRGGAQKEQVAFMVRALLGLRETPAADAADALAIGLTHLQRHARP